MEVVKKVVLAGHFGVGKTSLVRKFVYEKFSDQYLTTLGVRVSQKVVEVNDVNVRMMIWDIAGESTALKIPKKYIVGAHALIYVFDLSRSETYENMESDLFELHRYMKGGAFIVLGNKSDLIDDDEIEKVKKSVQTDFMCTSAKTNDNVQDAFFQIAKQLI